MNAAPDWSEANQQRLAAELALLRDHLQQRSDSDDDGAAPLQQQLDALPATPPSALDLAAQAFALSPFERSLLLLCCGVELDAGIAAACAQLHGQANRRNASFGLALALLPQAHWSALSPERPLRRWRLLEVEPGPRLVDAELRIDERVLHFVAGINNLDPRLRPLLQPLPPPALMAAEHETTATALIEHLASQAGPATLIHFDGNDTAGQQDIAAQAAAALGARLFQLHADDLPATAAELDTLRLLWEREARLLPALLLLHCESTPTPAQLRWMEQLQAPLLVAAREPLRLQRQAWSRRVDKPDASEQRRLWQQALGSQGSMLNGALDAIAAQFRLSAQAIAGIAADSSDTPELARELWARCRGLGRERLDDLAERIAPAAGWDDLILPPPQLATVKQIAAHLRQRLRVYQDWGFARAGARGLGVSALFSGESGTGKTLAAEVLAGELALDLYRIDLSAVVSKYIGETEKNLRRVFDAAEDSGAILLFDEADALFGKRSEVKDSHDRYANIEVSYLLQRMESYRGLAVLTTNLKSGLDRAFQRRLRFVIHFPFPDGALREAIWRRAFPPRTPLHQIDFHKLSRLNLPGGSIRNIALNAAFLAADAGQAVAMAHLLSAAQSESAKLERPLADAEIRGWHT